MEKRHLQQIKLFYIGDGDYKTVEQEANNYVAEIWNKTGNYPKIEANSKFISVICEEMVGVNN